MKINISISAGFSYKVITAKKSFKAKDKQGNMLTIKKGEKVKYRNHGEKTYLKDMDKSHEDLVFSIKKSDFSKYFSEDTTVEKVSTKPDKKNTQNRTKDILPANDLIPELQKVGRREMRSELRKNPKLVSFVTNNFKDQYLFKPNKKLDAVLNDIKNDKHFYIKEFDADFVPGVGLVAHTPIDANDVKKKLLLKAFTAATHYQLDVYNKEDLKRDLDKANGTLLERNEFGLHFLQRAKENDPDAYNIKDLGWVKTKFVYKSGPGFEY